MGHVHGRVCLDRRSGIKTLCCVVVRVHVSPRAGGTSLLSQMRERLELDISAAAPGGTKVKVTAPVNPTERRYATWIGA
jgi:hypothetical protein